MPAPQFETEEAEVAYREAEQRIAEAAREKAAVLNLSGLGLTSVPPEIGQLARLTTLLLFNNPLPAELLTLGGGGFGQSPKRLLEFLRAQADAQARDDAARLRRFDEAKLLLIGPGEVGKTWLLRALQGRVPQPTPSTRGIEIAREPLELKHPTDPDRTLHLTCWDFGGQDHYQVTHQIFFSPKSVYLLVWKPREGFDPEMEARLERIELSAGRTARVLIVSTHADEGVAARLGQEALRERFGDLIQGFYAVDSANGPDGIGIADLQTAIATAVAGLEGIDLAFPGAWHAVQQHIRQLEDPSVKFRQIVQVCESHGLDADMADTITGLMEVQGHAVYFPEAATDEDAGALAADNIVVLQPEWLAKAVSFVIDDDETNAAQGILAHARLPAIWRKDEDRGCPGYRKPVRKYLLWLMWKFDIAYRQDADTSLLPEMIARTRPDDVPWHTSTTAHGREIRAVCQLTSETTGRDIAIPKGLVPALTAAVHPLRQARDPHDPDRLDRNWNGGFFLHTAHRGEACVEQEDRELHVVVRHAYPRVLFEQLQKTLTQLIPTRWEHARLDLRVPCPGTLAARPGTTGQNHKRCPGTFRIDWLEGIRGSSASCQTCRGKFEVDRLLDGFDPKEAEIVRRLQELQSGQNELLTSQRELLAAAHAMFLAIDPENQARRRAPSLFTILPEQGTWRQSLTKKRVRITCWCEHPDGPHPQTPIGSNDPPDYVLSFPKDWLIKAVPYVSWGVMLLKAFVPLAGTVVSQGLSLNAGDALSQQIDLMKGLSSALPSGKLEIDAARDIDYEPGKTLSGTYRRSERPELESLMQIHELLLDEQQVPKSQRWGGLRPVQAKSGEILWLCREHAAIQSPPPLEQDI